MGRFRKKYELETVQVGKTGSAAVTVEWTDVFVVEKIYPTLPTEHRHHPHNCEKAKKIRCVCVHCKDHSLHGVAVKSMMVRLDSVMPESDGDSAK